MGLKALRDIGYVILPCNDLAAARRFYRDIMGLELTEDTRDWVVFALGARRLALRPRGPWLSWNDGAMPAGSAAVQLAFRVEPDEVEPAYRELRAKGAVIVEPPHDQAFGHRTCFVRDPEGNVLEIYAEI